MYSERVDRRLFARANFKYASGFALECGVRVDGKIVFHVPAKREREKERKMEKVIKFVFGNGISEA